MEQNEELHIGKMIRQVLKNRVEVLLGLLMNSTVAEQTFI